MSKAFLRSLLVVVVLSLALGGPHAASAAASAAAGKNLELVGSGSTQRGTTVGYAFVVNNPNADQMVEGSQYQVAAYDKSGAVLATDSGYIDLLLPKQKLGFGGEMSLPTEGLVVDSVEVQIKPGDFSAADSALALTSDKISYNVNSINTQHVTAVIKNPNKTALTGVRVNAVAYDKTGAISGGGYTYLSFIPEAGAKDPGVTGADISITAAGKPAKIEVYAATTSMTETPKANAEVSLVASGFGQKGDEIGFGLVLENKNKKLAYGGTQVRVVAYAKDGTVIGTAEDTVFVLQPSGKTGAGGSIYSVKAGVKAQTVVVQVLAGETKDPDTSGVLTADKAKYMKSDYAPKVTGVVKSTYKGNVSTITVHAICYDKAGKIVGGGYSYVDFVSSQGQSPAEVSVTTSGVPAKVELYPRLTVSSEIK